MPGFGTPFSVLANNVRLTTPELVRAIRFLIAAEYEAVQMHTQLADSTDNAIAIEVLHRISDEERVHAGELLRLLRELSPDEEAFYAKGAAEVEALLRGSESPPRRDSAYIRTSVDDPSPHTR